MTVSIEILVHVSGPSRGPDDARYRREAQELLEFEPVRKHRVLPLQKYSRGDHEYSFKQGIVEETERTPVWKSVISTNDLPSSLLERFENTTPYVATALCVKPHTSVLPMPPLLCTSKFDAAGPSRVTKATPQLHIHRTPALPRQRMAPSDTTPSKVASSPRGTKSDSWSTPPSVIPDSQPTYPTIDRPPFSSSPCAKRAFLAILSSSPSQSSDLKSRKRQCIQEKPYQTPAEVKGTDSSKSSVLSSSTRIAKETPYSPSSEGLPLEIYPPRPRPSPAQFSTHLTPSLQRLSTMLPLAEFFNPCVQTRSLDKLERGHWYIPIKSWKEVRKAKFWQYLILYIGEGKAGWGVWCSTEYESNGQNSGSTKENRDPEAKGEIVKVYCWGEVVGEVWLVLWLASAKRVISVGARWIDARGETVLEMN